MRLQSHMTPRFFSLLIAYGMTFVTAGPAMSQIGGQGSIQGSVTDSTGAAVPGATLTATNVATKVETTRQTTGSGFYQISPLPSGVYNVRVTAAGFQTTVQENVTVDALAVVGLNLTLAVGTVNESVIVTAAAPILQTDDATTGGSMRSETYKALPLAMNEGPRDPTMFIATIPGVTSVVTQVGGPTYASFNGGHENQNEVYVEGVPLTTVGQQGETRYLSLGVSVEAIEQFQVQINGQKAMFQGQGMSNYVIKSGTDQFHGSLFHYFRNTALDARGFFPPTTPVDHQNEFGGSVGGPIKKGKIFFFTVYDGYKYNTAMSPEFQSIPTLAARAGDFSAFPGAIYDPLSQTCAGAVCTKTPFANNRIGDNRISPISKSLQSYLVAPQNSGIQNNYLAGPSKLLSVYTSTNKVDLNLTDKIRLFGVYTQGWYSSDYTGALSAGTNMTPLPYTAGRVAQEKPRMIQVHSNMVLRPNLLNNFSISMARLNIPLVSATAGGGYLSKAGLKGLPAGQASDSFPTVTFAGPNSPIGWAGTNAVAFTQNQKTFTIQDNVLWITGKHALTTGFQLQKLQDNNENPLTGSSANFGFSNTQTAGFSPTGAILTNTGNAYASYLLGALNSTSIVDNNVKITQSRFTGLAFFVQDDWKVSPRFTVNLGLRYELLTPYVEKDNHMSWLNSSLPNPAAGGRPGALEFASDKRRVPIDTFHLGFSPRLGLAYSASDKTVIRASFGLNQARGGSLGGHFPGGGLGQLGYNGTGNFSSIVTGQPAFYWDNGVPVYQRGPFLDPGFGAGFTTENPGNAAGMNWVDEKTGGRPPYYINWSFGIQRQLSKTMTLEATYSASRGHFLAGAGALGIWTNSMQPKYLALGTLLAAQATPANLAAARAILPDVNLPFSNYQGTIAQALKPFPQYGGFTTWKFSNHGNSNYNALQVRFNHRLSSGLTAQFGYTFSKVMDDFTSVSLYGGGSGGTRDPYNGKLDKSLGVNDRTHVFLGTVVYSLPFGTGQRLGNGNAVARALVSNWQVSGLVNLTQGAPLAIGSSACNVPGMVSRCYPNYNRAFNGDVRINGNYGTGNVLGSNGAVYLDRNAFAEPAAFTLGEIARNAPLGLRVPYSWNVDMSVRRAFPIRERMRFAFQVDSFNFTNSVVFRAPSTSISSANFGAVTGQQNLPRKLQLSARFEF